MGKSKTKKLKVAVTGNIGSGKSTFVKYLSEKGFPVIIADEVSKELLANDPFVREKIINEFGSIVYDGNRINKNYLSDQIFSDPKKLKKINSILHPLVRQKIDSISKDYFSSNDVVFIEVALVYESKIENMFDYVVLIIADKEVRIKRSAQNNKIAKADFYNRNKNQIDDNKKIKRADIVFYNNDTVTELKSRADLLISLLENHHK
jgi:dephospho-CoA kinase